MTSALVIGCASCVWEDAEKAMKLFKPDMIVAVNHIGIDWPDRVDHWATCHVDLFPAWMEQRAAKGYEPAGQLWTNNTKIGQLPPELKGLGIKGVEYWDGSSGALGALAAIEAGADRVVLAGVPLTNGPHYYEGDHFTWDATYQRMWNYNYLKFDDKVRSVSGWTRELLGQPIKSWFKNAVRPDPEEV